LLLDRDELSVASPLRTARQIITWFDGRSWRRLNGIRSRDGIDFHVIIWTVQLEGQNYGALRRIAGTSQWSSSDKYNHTDERHQDDEEGGHPPKERAEGIERRMGSFHVGFHGYDDLGMDRGGDSLRK
jgi:hypothetical protein